MNEGDLIDLARGVIEEELDEKANHTAFSDGVLAEDRPIKGK